MQVSEQVLSRDPPQTDPLSSLPLRLRHSCHHASHHNIPRSHHSSHHRRIFHPTSLLPDRLSSTIPRRGRPPESGISQGEVVPGQRLRHSDTRGFHRLRVGGGLCQRLVDPDPRAVGRRRCPPASVATLRGFVREALQQDSMRSELHHSGVDELRLSDDI